MLIEVSGICQHCGAEIKTIVHSYQKFRRCHDCKALPFSIRRIPGLIYVLNHPRQVGVKIGMTEKSLEGRVKQLSNTSVPGKFDVIAVFPSERPSKDEKKVHTKVKKHWISGEHFNLDPIEAVLKAHRALNRRRPIFFDADLERCFRQRLEKARSDMQLKLRGKRKRQTRTKPKEKLLFE